MEENYKRMTNEEFEHAIDKLSEELEVYLREQDLKIDYICPILRSGAVPAVYLANKLNVVKFLPFQVKHVAYKNGDSKIEVLFNPLPIVEIGKDKPTFLLVDALNSTGTSAMLCALKIKEKYPDANILYVCIYKEYGEDILQDNIMYSNYVLLYKGSNAFTKEECDIKGIEYKHPLFPWEELEIEINHPDDLEENIYF